MSKRKIFAALAALAVAAGSWWGYKALTKPKARPHRVITASLGPIEDVVEATGNVAPLNRVEVKPEISGRIEKLLVDEGDQVKAGQIIAWMSSTDRAAILDAARAQGPDVLKKWESDYKATPVLAPMPGLVILRNVVEGQTVDPTVVLYAVSDTLIVLAQVDESDIGRVHIGMPARVTLDAYPDRPVIGKVFDILYEGKNVSNVITYDVKIKFDRVPSFFRSEMTANVDFILHKKPDALLVPLVAVHDSAGGGKHVLVPGPDGLPIPRQVKTGIEGEDSVEIVAGLSAGDQVLVSDGNYVPQATPQSSPLSWGGKKNADAKKFGQAPKPRRS